MSSQSLSILIVDDSLTDQKWISHILQKDPHLQVVGTLKNAKETLNFIDTLTPDLILIDINLPDLDGYHISQLVLNQVKVPIVLMSGSWKKNKNKEIENAIYSGALASLQKPSQDASECASFVKFVKEIAKNKTLEYVNIKAIKDLSSSWIYDQADQIIAIGASHGGPQAVKKLFSLLSPRIQPSVLLAIHSSDVPNEWMRDSLQEATTLPIEIVSNSTFMQPGHIYLCPNGQNMTLSRSRHLYLKPKQPGEIFCPSIDLILKSLAKYHAVKTLAVILSGLGHDAAQGAKILEEAGGMIVIQDQITCSSFSMPYAVLYSTKQPLILPIEKIAALINGTSGVRLKKRRAG